MARTKNGRLETERLPLATFGVAKKKRCRDCGEVMLRQNLARHRRRAHGPAGAGAVTPSRTATPNRRVSPLYISLPGIKRALGQTVTINAEVESGEEEMTEASGPEVTSALVKLYSSSAMEAHAKVLGYKLAAQLTTIAQDRARRLSLCTVLRNAGLQVSVPAREQHDVGTQTPCPDGGEGQAPLALPVPARSQHVAQPTRETETQTEGNRGTRQPHFIWSFGPAPWGWGDY